MKPYRNDANRNEIVTAQDYGLFLADEDIKKGVWLEPGRNLEYYILRNGVCNLLLNIEKFKIHH